MALQPSADQTMDSHVVRSTYVYDTFTRLGLSKAMHWEPGAYPPQLGPSSSGVLFGPHSLPTTGCILELVAEGMAL